MASHHHTDTPPTGGTPRTVGAWSPRNRLFFLVGATAATWGVVLLLIEVWV